MRKSGILMHVTSLPSPYGIGSMGKCAYEFVDFLCKAGQSYWQVLPLNPTGYGDSPYQSFSSFAGNHYLIDLDMLVEEQLLLQEEVDAVNWYRDETHVDFGCLFENRCKLLHLAYERFSENDEYRRFLDENADWLEDYGLFMSLKEKNRGRPWYEWSISLMKRLPGILSCTRQEMHDSVQFQYFLQYQFFRQWKALRSYANQRGIKIIGDVPIYVPLDSVDVWSAPELFQLDGNCRPTAVAGCPPDSFAVDGQLWGNPLYNWDKMKETGFAWWIRRLSAAAKMSSGRTDLPPQAMTDSNTSDERAWMKYGMFCERDRTLSTSSAPIRTPAEENLSVTNFRLSSSGGFSRCMIRAEL